MFLYFTSFLHFLFLRFITILFLANINNDETISPLCVLLSKRSLFIMVWWDANYIEAYVIQSCKCKYYPINALPRNSIKNITSKRCVWKIQPWHQLKNIIYQKCLVALHLSKPVHIMYFIVLHAQSQPTRNICITFVQRRPNVFGVDPTLYKCYANVLCLLTVTIAQSPDNRPCPWIWSRQTRKQKDNQCDNSSSTSRKNIFVRLRSYNVAEPVNLYLIVLVRTLISS